MFRKVLQVFCLALVITNALCGEEDLFETAEDVDYLDSVVGNGINERQPENKIPPHVIPLPEVVREVTNDKEDTSNREVTNNRGLTNNRDVTINSEQYGEMDSDRKVDIQRLPGRLEVVFPRRDQSNIQVQRFLENVNLAQYDQNQATVQQVPSSVQRLQSTVQQSQPNVESSQPSEQQSQPNVQRSQSSIQQSLPNEEQSQPSVQQLQPNVQRSQSSIQQSLPNEQESQPNVQQQLPNVQQSQPNVHHTQSIIQQSLPNIQYPQSPNVQYVPPSVQHSPSSVQHSSSSVQHFPSSVQHSSSWVQHAPTNVQHSSSWVQHAPTNVQHLPPNEHTFTGYDTSRRQLPRYYSHQVQHVPAVHIGDTGMPEPVRVHPEQHQKVQRPSRRVEHSRLPLSQYYKPNIQHSVQHLPARFDTTKIQYPSNYNYHPTAQQQRPARRINHNRRITIPGLYSQPSRHHLPSRADSFGVRYPIRQDTPRPLTQGYSSGSTHCETPFVSLYSGCYLFADSPTPEGLTWYEADSFCIRKGASGLAALDSSELNDAVVRILKYASADMNGDWWIGGKRTLPTFGEFEWESTGKELGFNRWASSSPQVDESSRNCMKMDSHYEFLWTADNCETKLTHYVCQKS